MLIENKLLKINSIPIKTDEALLNCIYIIIMK
jgi:hypothetical protein